MSVSCSAACRRASTRVWASGDSGPCGPSMRTWSGPAAWASSGAIVGSVLHADSIPRVPAVGGLAGAGATGRFFMRVHFEAPPQLADVATLNRMLSNVTQQFEMDSQLHSLARRPRVLMMVSQHGHCLNDLLFRWHSGQLDIDI